VEEILKKASTPFAPIATATECSASARAERDRDVEECCCRQRDLRFSDGAPLEKTATAERADEEVTPEGTRVVRYGITNMDCPVEERLIRDKLQNFPGVSALRFNLLKRILTVHHNLDDLEALEAALLSIDMKPVRVKDGENESPPSADLSWKKLVVAAAVALASEASQLLGAPFPLVLTLAILAIVLAGFTTYKKGWIAIRNLNLNMNALMSFAVTGAVLIGEIPEAAMVMVLFTLAESIEDRSLARARNAIKGLLNLAPEKATVQNEDGSFSERKAADLAPGARVRVRPGEKLSLDGKIIVGSSTINEAPITGESKPVEKSVGDSVFAGTVNESGSFEYEVTEPFENSTLSRILKAVEEAQSSRAPIQRFVDRFAQIYTPGVFLVAMLIGAIPPLFMGEPVLTWIYRALVTLVIACPCALVISTPVTIVSGLAAATKKGLLIKGGVFLEEGRKIATLALDKTGTLTSGKPVLTDMLALGDMSPATLRVLAGSLAHRSDHPVSKAIFEGLSLPPEELLPVQDFKALPGEGTSGIVSGKTLFLGNLRLVKRLANPAEEFLARARELEKRGKSVVAIFGEGEILGIFGASDQSRPESRLALEELHQMGIRTVMLTGDNANAAQAVAQEVGVKETRSGLLPQEKLDAIAALGQEGKVAMVGDGINDAPALAKADIGFAMGAFGTDAAIETASVAIMDDDLRKIPAFIRLSRETNWHLWENISFSLVVKAAFLALTFMGFTRMWMAVFADIGVCLIVVANGLRLLKK
jgi:Cd2+/Zn2+-exporting ATPase